METSHVALVGAAPNAPQPRAAELRAPRYAIATTLLYKINSAKCDFDASSEERYSFIL
jgi:hypothetical protein